MSLSLGIGLGLGQQRAADGFSPLSLFSNGEEGAWYDPSDISTLWQDTARTIPVTSDLDRVAVVDDKSGNGNHAIQTAAYRYLTYRTVGGLSWLDFDGLNDHVKITAFDLTSTDKISTFMGVRRDTNPAVAAVIFETTNNWSASNGTIVSSVTSSGDVDYGSRGTISVQLSNSGTSTPGSDYILTGLSDISAPFVKIRLDGVEVESSTASQGTGNYGNHNAYLGMRGDEEDFPFDGRIYSLIIRAAASSAEEIADTESYVADASGVTL